MKTSMDEEDELLVTLHLVYASAQHNYGMYTTDV